MADEGKEKVTIDSACRSFRNRFRNVSSARAADYMPRSGKSHALLSEQAAEASTHVSTGRRAQLCDRVRRTPADDDESVRFRDHVRTDAARHEQLVDVLVVDMTPPRWRLGQIRHRAKPVQERTVLRWNVPFACHHHFP